MGREERVNSTASPRSMAVMLGRVLELRQPVMAGNTDFQEAWISLGPRRLAPVW